MGFGAEPNPLDQLLVKGGDIPVQMSPDVDCSVGKAVDLDDSEASAFLQLP